MTVIVDLNVRSERDSMDSGLVPVNSAAIKSKQAAARGRGEKNILVTLLRAIIVTVCNKMQ